MNLILGDCVERLRELEPASVDAVVCDPPYELGFMGKQWDAAGVSFRKETWTEVARVLKPGGHLLAFGGSRTFHRIAVAVEDAGFEIRDTIMWLYGSGFPKSLDVAKAIDRKLGVEGSYEGVRAGHEDFVERTDIHAAGGRADGWSRPWQDDPEARERHHLAYVSGSPEARDRQGWGTALKPAFEPIVVARKPLDGTVAENVLEHGVGAINVDACRIEYLGAADEDQARVPQPQFDSDKPGVSYDFKMGEGRNGETFDPSKGRWPANVVLSHTDDCVPVGVRQVTSDGHYPAARPGGVEIGTTGHAGQADLEERYTAGELVETWECAEDCPVRLLDEQTGILRSGEAATMREAGADRAGNSSPAFSQESRPAGTPLVGYGDEGGASRFFYCAKTSRAERDAGLDGFYEGDGWARSHAFTSDPRMDREQLRRASRNNHPTVKPVDLMRWLVRLVTPPDGVVLDPFMGSGTTGIACLLEGFDFVGVERDEGYYEIAAARLAFWEQHGDDALRIVAKRSASERRRVELADAGQLDLFA